MTIEERLRSKGLKVTPQRVIIFEALQKLDNHPTADNIIEYIRQKHPSIASGTVYNVLDTLVDNDLVTKVKTEKDIMRYDSYRDKHHHLYCADSDKIQDYRDEELDQYLEEYFQKKGIPDFQIKDIRLQIIGKFM